VAFLDRSLYSVGLLSEEMNFTVLVPSFIDITDGDRIEVKGKMYGVALF